MLAALRRPPTPSPSPLPPVCDPAFPPRAHGRVQRVVAAAGLAAALLLHPHLAFGQDDGGWSEGTWPGDEGPGADVPPRFDDQRETDGPRDGYDTWDRQQERERERDRAERARENWREGHDRGHGHAYGRRGRDDRDGEEGDEAFGDDRAVVLRAGPSMADFRESLNPYGQWIDTPEYGLVWRPAVADDGFRPYYAGRWAWTDAGWYWVADEPYGWAVYHYGRWAYVSGLGWSWLPGRIWAPAWVSWRWGEGYAGWCPLGPRGVIYQQPAWFVMVPQPQFLAPVQQAAVPTASAARFFPRTVALPVRGPGPRAGPVVHAVAQVVGHPIQPLAIADAPAPPRRSNSASAGVVYAYRPRTQAIPRAATAAPAASPRPGNGNGNGNVNWNGNGNGSGNGNGNGPVRAPAASAATRWNAAPTRPAPAPSPAPSPRGNGASSPRLSPAPGPSPMPSPAPSQVHRPSSALDRAPRGVFQAAAPAQRMQPAFTSNGGRASAFAGGRGRSLPAVVAQGPRPALARLRRTR